MLKQRRKKLGISQKNLSVQLGISQGYLSKLENLQCKNVNLKIIRGLSNKLMLDPVEVFLFFYNSI